MLNKIELNCAYYPTEDMIGYEPPVIDVQKEQLRREYLSHLEMLKTLKAMRTWGVIGFILMVVALFLNIEHLITSTVLLSALITLCSVTFIHKHTIPKQQRRLDLSAEKVRAYNRTSMFKDCEPYDFT